MANGDFTVRVNHAEHGYVPREMVEFEQSFNKAAEELGGTEILRKDLSTTSPTSSKRPSSVSAVLPTCCWKSSCRPRIRRNT